MMARLLLNIVSIYLMVTSVRCDEDTDEDTSLVKLLSQQNSERNNLHQDHVELIENNINGGGFISDEVPLLQPSKVEGNSKPFTLVNLTLSASDLETKNDDTESPTPKQEEDDNAQKREEERYEETIGNPNPRPEYFQHVPDTLDFSSIHSKQEMEEGDEGKEEGWKELKANHIDKYIYDTDDTAQNQHVNSILENDENQTDGIEDSNVKQFTSVHDIPDKSNDIKVDDFISEEKTLGQRINFLKNKLQQKIKQNTAKHRHFVFKNMTMSKEMLNSATKPKYTMKLLTRINDNTFHSQANKESSSSHINPYQKQINELSTNQLIFRNLTNTNGKLLHRKELFAFSYDPASPFGPQYWQMLNSDWTCKGRKQSPINIDNRYIMDDQIIKNVILKVTPGNTPITGVIKNNGHSPTLTLSNDISIKLYGGTLINDYYLKQLHFHFGCDSSSGSEHHIDGIVYPLEVHLVFWDNSTFVSFPDAAKADRGIAVLSVLYQLEGMLYTEAKESPLAQVVQVLHHIEQEGDEQPITEEFNFRLERLIPNVMSPDKIDRFFMYEGSLSTPGCYESVTWIVFATHPPVTENQLESFRKLQSTKVAMSNKMCNNFRPLQKKNGRRIYSNIV